MNILIAVYMICVIGLGSYLYGEFHRDGLEELIMAKVEKLLEEDPDKMIEIYGEQLNRDPDNLSLLQALAGIYTTLERERDAVRLYERLLGLQPDNALALNNLSWILITSPDKKLRKPERGLVLAKKAVAIKRAPEYLDTLAEALFVNGSREQAVDIIKEAVSIAPDNVYYQEQLKRFSSE